MKFFCKGHIALAIASGAVKAKDGNVIIAKAFDKKCQWSGCVTPEESVYSMKYEGMQEDSTTEAPEPEIPATEEKPTTA